MFSAGISTGSNPSGIAAGPDGNIWFTEPATGRIGRITPAGGVTEFAVGISAGAVPDDIAARPDGNLWFTESSGDRIGRITTTGVVTEFSTGITPGSSPEGIAAGPDGNIWFTEFLGNRIGNLAIAHTKVWSGGGGDNRWSTAANWSASIGPMLGDDLAFQGAAQTVTNNNLPAGTVLHSLTLASAGFQLGGNGVVLASTSGPVVSLCADSGTIQLPISLASNATIAVTNPNGSLTASGTIDNGGFGLTVESESSRSSMFTGSISGSGGLIKTGGGQVVLSGPNSFTGGVQVLAGALVIGAADALPSGSNLTVGAGADQFFAFSASNASRATNAAAIDKVMSSTGFPKNFFRYQDGISPVKHRYASMSPVTSVHGRFTLPIERK
jgi:autotransporter-associated beta strand protein